MRRAVAIVSLALACGDNGESRGVDLAEATELVVVAHAGDDLMLMQPDLLEAVQRGGVTTVYLQPPPAGALDGLRAAYAHAADAADDDFQCGTITIEGHEAEHCRLTDANVSLVFLPAGASLAPLIRIMRVSNPRVVRTLEVTGTHGDDDDDHIAAGRQAVLALAAGSRSAQLVAYRGDNIAAEPPNKPKPLFDTAFAMLERFGTSEQRHVDLLLRRYAVGMRRNGGGQLRISNQCLTADLALASCDTAPVWTLDGAGQLRTADRCLAVDPMGALSLQPCLGDADRRWFVDDDGHILSAVDGLRCLTPAGAALGLEPCSATSDPRWELVPATHATPRDSLGIVATGRDVRLADIDGDRWADLCAVEAGELHCALGTGTGTFGPAVRIDHPDAPLAIDARSLTLGDVDGDGRIDACGRDEMGLVCATAQASYAATRFSPAFDAVTALPTSSASLTALDADSDGVAELCGVDMQGLVCVKRSTQFVGTLRSAWPADDAVVWFGDLDGDGAADWCAATDAGPACGVWTQRTITFDGIPWGYAQDRVVEVAPATTVTVALGDIDGDGRADLCSLRDDRIVCARSQGRGFGPRVTLAILPNQTTASALWLGDLDGDGRADPCVDTGTAIVCARQP